MTGWPFEHGDYGTVRTPEADETAGGREGLELALIQN
jgi:hypothetical protein